MNTGDIFESKKIATEMSPEDFLNEWSTLKCSECKLAIAIKLDAAQPVQYNRHFLTAECGFYIPAGVKLDGHTACEEIAQARENEIDAEKQKELLTKKRWDLFNKYVSELGFADSENVTFANAALGLKNDHTVSLLKAWKSTDSFGFLIQGPAGTGKTYLAVSLIKKIAQNAISKMSLNDIHEIESKSKFSGLPVFISVVDVYRETFSNHFQIPRHITHARFLFLDDLGTENVTDQKREVLFNLLETRLTLKYPTFITTNLSLNDLRERFYERIQSRILGLCVPVKVEGEDKRKDISKSRIQELESRINNKGSE